MHEQTVACLESEETSKLTKNKYEEQNEELNEASALEIVSLIDDELKYGNGYSDDNIHTI